MDITWTEAGVEHAYENCVDREQVEAMLRGDIERGDVRPDLLIGHVVEVGDVAFMVTPAAGGGLLIDGCTWERHTMAAGPFAGRDFCIPKAMSGENEE